MNKKNAVGTTESFGRTPSARGAAASVAYSSAKKSGGTTIRSIRLDSVDAIPAHLSESVDSILGPSVPGGVWDVGISVEYSVLKGLGKPSGQPRSAFIDSYRHLASSGSDVRTRLIVFGESLTASRIRSELRPWEQAASQVKEPSGRIQVHCEYVSGEAPDGLRAIICAAHQPSRVGMMIAADDRNVDSSLADVQTGSWTISWGRGLFDEIADTISECDRICGPIAWTAQFDQASAAGSSVWGRMKVKKSIEPTAAIAKRIISANPSAAHQKIISSGAIRAEATTA